MRVDWCVSSWFRIKNTHSLTPLHGLCTNENISCGTRVGMNVNTPVSQLGFLESLIGSWGDWRMELRTNGWSSHRSDEANVMSPGGPDNRIEEDGRSHCV